MVNTLGGSRVPAFALTNIGTDTEPGKVTMTVMVKDVARQDQTRKLKRNFEVKKMELRHRRPGFVYLYRLNEEEAGRRRNWRRRWPCPVRICMLHFSVVGFQEGATRAAQPVKVTMEIQDEAGKSGVEKTVHRQEREIRG